MAREAQPRWRRTRFGDNEELMLRTKWLGTVGPLIEGECRYLTPASSGTAASRHEAKHRVLAEATVATLDSRQTQFLREACNPHGRVAGHNNRLAVALEQVGLIRRDNRGLIGQSNFLITDLGRIALQDSRSG